MTWTTVEELCDRHLGRLPSSLVVARLKKIETERAEVRDFLERVLRLMAAARLGAENIPPHLAAALSFLVPHYLPGSWGVSVPRVTSERRHERINAYIADNPWASFGPGAAFLEVGCGFPPYTAIDVARSHPEWSVIGADPSFDEYLLYDEKGNYAALNRDGRIRDFYPSTDDPLETLKLYSERPETLGRFSELFSRLQPLVPAGADGELTRAERDGARLILNPLRLYETANLKLRKAGLGDDFGSQDVIRCFNVLCYFDEDFRKDAETWAARTLRPGGLFICGGDGYLSTDARYTVYRNEDGRLAAKEFAFSIDSVRPYSIVPWYTMHEGERDTATWVRLLGILRSDAEFRQSYDARLDALFAEKGIYTRDPDGFLAPVPNQRPQGLEPWRQIGLRLEAEGFAGRALQVLRNAGLKAWLNSAGHIAIDPTPLSPL